MKHEVAWWSSVAAFFSSLLTIGAIDVIDPSNVIKLTGSIIIAVVTGGAMYSKQRLDEARDKRDEGRERR